MRLTALFARTSDDTVDDVIAIAAWGWFAVALLQIVMLAFTAVNGRLAGGDAVDPMVSAMGGWFLLKTKSRAVAWALLVYGVVTATVCAGRIFGVVSYGVPLATSAVALYAGWRGVAGTHFWQKRACAITDWRHVAFAMAAALLITLVSLVVVLAATADHLGRGRDFLVSAALFLVPVAVVIVLTRRRAFARNDPACPWPPNDL